LQFRVKIHFHASSVGEARAHVKPRAGRSKSCTLTPALRANCAGTGPGNPTRPRGSA
jgi:hypothetical protein